MTQDTKTNGVVEHLERTIHQALDALGGADDADNGQDPNVLPNGAEIHFTGDRDAHVPDRVEFLPGGFVKGIYKNQYEIIVYPPDAIEGIYTHTNHLEDEEWW